MSWRFKITLIIILVLPAEVLPQGTVPHSVLSSGKWFKIAVTEDGIYRVDYSKLKELGLVDPSKPRIFSNNIGQLSFYNNGREADDLKEMAIYYSGSDSILSDGEYILFYGQSPHRWIYDHSTGNFSFLRHNYSDTAYYFLTSSEKAAKLIISKDSSLISNRLSNSSDVLYIHEKEIKNLLKSGREWFQPVSSSSGVSVDPQFTDLITSEKIKYRIRVAARASTATAFRISEGPGIIKTIQVTGLNLYNYTGTYANIVEYSDSLTAQSSSPKFDIKYVNNGITTENAGWLDFITFHARRGNKFSGTILKITDSGSVGNGNTTEFRVESGISGFLIWDVTDQHNISNMLYRIKGSSVSFKDISDSLRNYIVFSPANARNPIINTVSLPNQDLHASLPCEMVIVYHPLFRKYATQLADIHKAYDGIESLLVTPAQIYNEFSGGIPDIVAIRNFMRMKFLSQKNTSKHLKYLLLFGDGSYENKTLPPKNPNYIPTYQSQNSNIVVSTYTSDDFYGLLEDNEGESEGTEDIGIGRLPVNDTSQASLMITKIKAYINPENNGDWKNRICLVADDEDGNTHLSDAENLAKIMDNSFPAFNLDKIYLDAFRQTTTVSGQTYPEVNKAINDRINAGCLVFNYVGHGSENGLAHEGILTTSDIRSWQNTGRLSLLITATCEFSRFDDMEYNDLTGGFDQKTSAGELALLGTRAGAIALMSTTRVVYSAPNAFLNRNIFQSAFSKDSSGMAPSLGEIIRIAKNNSGSGANKRNFTLLGDPALRLAYPWHGKIITDSVENLTEEGGSDTLKALSMVNITGHIEDIHGKLINDFNGIVSPVVFDKTSSVRTLANDGGSAAEFDIRQNVIFSGKTRALNGSFSFRFIVPRDINYSPGPGKISYYATQGNEDMQGYSGNIIVGGFAINSAGDTKGPDIKLFMNDTLFRNGGITTPNPRLLAFIEDEGGINTTGSGIGHDIIAYLDNNLNNTVVLNEYFENDFDNYSSGRLIYDLTSVSEGSHSLTLKAWDNFNNSTVSTIFFNVNKSGSLVIENLVNYPNPFREETKIEAQHNRPDTEIEITIRIYNLYGKPIKIVHDKYYSPGFVTIPFIWDGKDSRGARAAQGVYPYTITIKTPEGETATESGRLIIL